MKLLKLIVGCLVLGVSVMALTASSALAFGNRIESASVAAPASNDGLIAYWDFEGSGTTLDDVSGNGHHGVIYNATFVPGKIGQAMRFDGQGDYVEVANASDLSGWNAFTFEAWVYRPGLSDSWQKLMHKPANNLCANGESYNFLWRQHPDLVATDGDGINSTFEYGFDQGYTLSVLREPASLDYAWHHFAVTYDGSLMRGYVDGVPDNEIPASGQVVQTTSPLFIGVGVGWCSMQEWFLGDVDELKLYSRARSADEIAQDAGMFVPAEVDLVPGTVNLMSHGNWLTAYLEFPVGYDPAEVDLASVRLASTIPAITKTKYGWVKNPAKYLTDHDGDGILERMVRFDADAVRAYLKSIGARGMTTLSVNGVLAGIPFEAQDVVRVKK